MLTEDQLILLRCVRDGASRVEMAEAMKKSLAWAGKLFKKMVDEGYVNHQEGKARRNFLTPKAEEELRVNRMDFPPTPPPVYRSRKTVKPVNPEVEPKPVKKKQVRVKKEKVTTTKEKPPKVVPNVVTKEDLFFR